MYEIRTKIMYQQEKTAVRTKIMYQQEKKKQQFEQRWWNTFYDLDVLLNATHRSDRHINTI